MAGGAGLPAGAEPEEAAGARSGSSGGRRQERSSRRSSGSRRRRRGHLPPGECEEFTHSLNLSSCAGNAELIRVRCYFGLVSWCLHPDKVQLDPEHPAQLYLCVVVTVCERPKRV